jgi:hypothetical protein
MSTYYLDMLNVSKGQGHVSEGTYENYVHSRFSRFPVYVSDEIIPKQNATSLS